MLDRNSPLPMYHQVKNNLIKLIQNGDFKVGDKIYSEREICQIYSVSGITAKRVLNEMAQEGYITRHPGRGSFVTKTAPISHLLTKFYSFTDEMKLRGMTPSCQLLNLEWAVPPEKGIQFLQLKEGEKALLVKRKRFSDGELITLDHSYLHCSACPQVTEQRLETMSLYEILRANGVIPHRAIESFDAISVGKEDAILMGVTTGTALLRVHRCTYSDDKPIEYNYRYYMPNRYLYSIELGLGG